MTVQTQTTIRILIVAVAGLATVGLARPGPTTHVSEAGVSRAIPSVEVPSGLDASGPRPKPTAGFAIFCEDRR